MKALISLIFFALVVGQITARHSRLSRDCLNGVKNRFKCCKGVPNAWYAHMKNPKDCGTFYQCDNGEPVLRKCPKGLKWSVAADRCEHPKYARCNSNYDSSEESGERDPLLPNKCYNGKLSAKKCCKGISEWWVHLPDPEDCTKFYHCDNGKAVHKDCPANLHWSVAANRCEWPHLAGCQGVQPTEHPTEATVKPTKPATKPTEVTARPTEVTEQPTKKPVVVPGGCYNGSISAKVCCEGVSDWWVHLPDPENCGKFYQCDNGQAVQKDCPGGLHWSVVAGRCEWPEIAGCQTSATGKPTNEPTNGPTEGSTNSPTNVPTNGPTEEPTNGSTDRPTNRPTEESTNRPTEGPISTQKPVLPGECYDGSINAKVCCEGVSDWWVHLPDPENCGKFYQCDNGQAVQKDCPGGLHWSVVADRCEWPEIAGCQTSPTGKPTDGPTNGPTEGTTNGPTEGTTNGPTEEPTNEPTEEPTNEPTEGPTNGPTEGPTNGPTEEQTNRPTEEQTNRPTEGPTNGPTNIPTNGPTEGPVSTQRPVLPGGCYDGSINAIVCCEGISDWWVHLPDPENCGKFYQCDNGQAVHKDCPAGLHWSVVADRCEWPEIAGCQTSLTGKPTVGPTNGPTEGSTNRPTEGTTNEPTEEPTNELTEVPTNGPTEGSTNVPTEEQTNGPTEGPTNGPTEESTNGPTEGSTNRPTNIPTNDPTERPVSTQKPVLPGGCYNGNISAKVCCEGVSDWWVHLPDPENCGKFYQCDNGQAVHKDCPDGLHWSVVADRCEWPEIAGCQISPTGKPTIGPTNGPTGGPTSESTEGPSNGPTEGPTNGSTDRPTNGPTEGPASTQKPVLPGGCYDGSISAKVCCEGISDWWVHLPDPENCNKFYQCDNGQVVHKDCPAGLHWSVAADRCEWHEIAGCQTSTGNSTDEPISKPTEEPTNGPTERPTNELTDGPTNGPTDGPTNGPTNGPEEGNCSPIPVFPQCYTGIFSAEFCCKGIKNWQKVHLAHPQDCTSYYDCVNEVAILRKCPEGLHWSIRTDRCEWPTNAQCSTSTGNGNENESGGSNGEGEGNNNGTVSEGCLYGEIDPNTCCENVPETADVLLQNNNNCHSYYQCVHGKPFIRSCPAGLWWSVNRNRCEWRRNATCTWETEY